MQVFPWSECQVKETGDKSLYNNYNLQIQRRDAVWYLR